MDFKCVSNRHLEKCSVQDILTLGCLQSAHRTSELHWWTELVDPQFWYWNALMISTSWYCCAQTWPTCLLCWALSAAQWSRLVSPPQPFCSQIPTVFAVGAYPQTPCSLKWPYMHNLQSAILQCGRVATLKILAKDFTGILAKNWLRSDFRVKIFLGKHAPRPP